MSMTKDLREICKTFKRKKMMKTSNMEIHERKNQEQLKDTIIQNVPETDHIEIRKIIYLTIKSTFVFEETGHKLLQIRLKPGHETELLCGMVIECCTEERTYRSYYGHLANRLCLRSETYREWFGDLFKEQYENVHRLETNKLRSVAMFFAHLLANDALPWDVLGYVRLTEEDTTFSSRIFIKFLFQELSEQLGIKGLSEKLEDPSLKETFESIFPKDHPKNTRFSINFFTSIGLGFVTTKLREFLLAKRKKPDKESGDET